MKKPRKATAAAKHGQDVDALAFNPEDTRKPTSKHFIPREGSRKRGLEITFDPDKHKCAARLTPPPPSAPSSRCACGTAVRIRCLTAAGCVQSVGAGMQPRCVPPPRARHAHASSSLACLEAPRALQTLCHLKFPGCAPASLLFARQVLAGDLQAAAVVERKHPIPHHQHLARRARQLCSRARPNALFGAGSGSRVSESARMSAKRPE